VKLGFQLPITIAEAIKRIQTQDLVLPAIQREFVWEEPQITRLFDSLLRGYPIGSFLSWKIEPSTAAEFRFYGFLKDYHEKENPHCPVLDLPGDKTVIAVLDGQQRLTALNVGLRGSYAARVKGGWWDNPLAFPKTRLYLNVVAPAEENELGMLYDFRMLPEPVAQPDDLSAYWYPVYRLFEIQGIAELMGEVAEHNLGNNKEASTLIGDLYKAIHSSGTLYFYEETDQNVEKVLDIFIRVNSGGTVLSYSDLLLSIATAQWAERDAREEVHSLVDDLNATGQGFRFSKDVLLKSGLVLTGVSDIGFKVKNFNHANMASLEKQWDTVREALGIAVGLLSDFGLSEATLTAGSVLIPAAYYVHRRELTNAYRTQPATAEDRRKMRSWVLRSLVKQGVWGSGLDTLLRELRDAIDTDGAEAFPLEQLESRMAARGKGLTFLTEEIEDLLDSKYGGKRTFAVLALLFPHVNTRNIHHIDHVYPQSLLWAKKLKGGSLDKTTIERIGRMRDLLPNLQLLEGPENIGKKDSLPLEWAEANFQGESFEAYLSRNELPGLPSGPNEFEDWFGQRREALALRLAKVLDVVPVALKQSTE
jgi:hypothetical protein